MRKYDCRFESLGTEIFFGDGLICEDISFRKPHEPALMDEKIAYAAETLTSMFDWNDLFYNRDVLDKLEKLGIGRHQFPAMLGCLLSGDNYKDVVCVNGIRVSLYEIQFILRIWREDDDDHAACSYLVIPLKDSSGRMVLRDLVKYDEKVKITWEKGLVTGVT